MCGLVWKWETLGAVVLGRLHTLNPAILADSYSKDPRMDCEISPEPWSMLEASSPGEKTLLETYPTWSRGYFSDSRLFVSSVISVFWWVQKNSWFLVCSGSSWYKGGSGNFYVLFICWNRKEICPIFLWHSDLGHIVFTNLLVFHSLYTLILPGRFGLNYPYQPVCRIGNPISWMVRLEEIPVLWGFIFPSPKC